MARKNRPRERALPEQDQPHNPSTAERSQPAAPRLLSPGVGLKLLVFTAGGVLMGLEIAGSRVLAPYFGNSVFVWGSLISIFLIALSLGYYIGGRVADRWPSHGLLSTIGAVVAVLIFAIAVIARGLCSSMVDAGFGERSGPLVAASILFLLPSVGMGMVSPFAIRLAAHSLRSVGQIAGALYALSTAGSIVGTLLTTFVLIPLVGVSVILQGLAAVLMLVSLITLPLSRRAQATAGGVAVALMFMAGTLWPEGSAIALGPFDSRVVDADTPYHHISVVDSRNSLVAMNNVRSLRFDRYIESAIELEEPYASLAGYTNFFHLAMLARDPISSTLFIGAGGGIGPREFHMQDPKMAIDVVDIDPKVLELARTKFFLDDSPQIHTIADDGRMFLRRTKSQYDCIILDAFSAGGRIPFHLVTREFLELCRDRMPDDGVFVMNINSALEGPLSKIFQSMYRTVSVVFPQTYVFALGHQEGERRESVNIILLATRAEKRITTEQWEVRARTSQTHTYINNRRLEEMVDDLVSELPDTSRAPCFTDDYAPIETMPF